MTDRESKSSDNPGPLGLLLAALCFTWALLDEWREKILSAWRNKTQRTVIGGLSRSAMRKQLAELSKIHKYVPEQLSISARPAECRVKFSAALIKWFAWRADCAWCKKRLKGWPWAKSTTHGICQRCSERELARVRGNIEEMQHPLSPFLCPLCLLPLRLDERTQTAKCDLCDFIWAESFLVKFQHEKRREILGKIKKKEER